MSDESGLHVSSSRLPLLISALSSVIPGRA